MQGEMTDRLLNIQSAYLEAYLVQTAQSQPENITAANMLWKYYEKVNFTISFNFESDKIRMVTKFVFQGFATWSSCASTFVFGRELRGVEAFRAFRISLAGLS